jgi:hypothetical protein
MNATCRLAVAATLLAAVALPALASPCAAPAEFVKASAGERQPLTRPFVVNGIAVTAVHQRDGASWLELAVDSEGTARRALSAQGAAGGEITRAGDVVLLSCRGLLASAHAADAAGRRVATLAAPLW